MAKSNERRKQHAAVQTLGEPPFVIMHSHAYLNDLANLPTETRALARLTEDELSMGKLGLFGDKAALKPLEGELQGIWRVGFGPTRGPRYRMCFLPQKAPKRGPRVLLMLAVLPRADVYRELKRRLGRAS